MVKKWLIKGISLCLLIGVMSGCSSSKDTIKIASKPMSEQFVLTEMLKQLIEEDTDLQVEITKGVGGGTSNIQPAMLKGDFDIYPEYTGTAWLNVLKETEVLDDETLFQQLQETYKSEYNFEWVGLYGFNNTYTLALRKEIADQYNITTFSDLAAYAPQITFGGNADFVEREDGLVGLSEAYGYTFKTTMDIDIALKYTALAEKQIDVTNAYTTDSGLATADVTVLEDDQKFFKNYYCGTVIRGEVLEKHPELRAVLMKMENLISNADMAKMNAEVDSGKNEEDVAHDFLVSKGLLTK